MDYVSWSILALSTAILIYMAYKVKAQGYTGDNLSAVQLYDHAAHTVYREEQLIPDDYNVPKPQKLLGVHF